MSNFGSGQWVGWEGYPWGTPFLWTTLHTFGGNDAIHGNISRANRIPYDALGLPAQVPGVVPAIGAGFTAEGFDQNPAVRRVRRVPLASAFVLTLIAAVLRGRSRGCVQVGAAG